jgi:hypothetical protein
MDEKTLSYQDDQAVKLAGSIRSMMNAFIQAGKESLETATSDYVEDRA